MSAVSRGSSLGSLKGSRGLSAKKGYSRRRGSWQRRTQDTSLRDFSGNERRDDPGLHLEVGGVRTGRGRHQPAVGGGEEGLRRERPEVAEQVPVLLRIELRGDVVEEQERRPPERRPEVLDLGDLEREHHRALLALAPVEPRGA